MPEDWMIPRRLHALQEGGLEQTPHSYQVDPALLQKRELRKKNTGPQASATNKQEPWSHYDRSIARRLPAFSDRMWTLGDTSRWVIERTPEAVDGLSVDEDRLPDVLLEIHAALSEGEISAFATTVGDPVPRALPAQTWAVYVLALEIRNGLIRAFASHDASLSGEQQLLNLRLQREDVLQRWPGPTSTSRPVETTVGAENQCRRWLVETMTAAPNQPTSKRQVLQEAIKKFPKLSGRGFNRAWDAAIRESHAKQWRAPGRRRR